MAIQYSIYQDPPRRDGKKTARHIQVKGHDHINSEELAKKMGDDVYGRSVCIGVLSLLSSKLPELLADGCAVHINGVGTFTPKVSGDIHETRRNGSTRVQARALRVTGIDFQPDGQLLAEINQRARFEHLPERRMTEVTEEELRAFLARHFSAHDELRRSDLVEAFNISKDRAHAILHQWVEDGTLIHQGSRGASHYKLKTTI